MIKSDIKLVDGVRPEGVANLGTVKCYAHGALPDRPVIGDVGKRVSLYLCPAAGIEMLGDHRENVDGRQ
jgi:hypothetical protein